MTATARTGIRTEMFTHPVLESCVGCPAYSVEKKKHSQRFKSFEAQSLKPDVDGHLSRNTLTLDIYVFIKFKFSTWDNAFRVL